MSVTTLDIDDSVLERVLRLSGLRTKKDAVNLALREYAERHERIAALEHFAEVGESWDYAAWRAEHDGEKAGPT
ncbi:Arc/MetJ family transcription regulator [Stackebrandtia albiflava]|uniref:Arc/MetJ family transcription regulator n=1 Tax=Stackebrandtia albiflava TaxID=406432 RepID=A0A562V382_9ACTN|nr:type II toxin-antitoxin system VapB family antitoxin [Stackebrandtia albiflava]TWJ12315.1 Arc/MetJ family transcription regulator [Stackebrandtia albiflava]